MTSPASQAAQLRADCIADSAGGLTFDVTTHGGTGVAHLLLRRRDTHQEVSLPLAPAAVGRLRAALPSSVALPEGRWDAYARVADGEPRRLAPGVTDLRSLTARTPTGSRVAVRIPYATRQGNLSVRSWLRAPHAEADELRLEDAELTVRGRVYGIRLGPDACAELRERHGSRPVRRTGVAVGQAEFRLTVPYGALRPGVWDLWLRPVGEAGPRVRIARLLDDVADKQPVLICPRVRVRTPDGPVEAAPYYTRDNDLSLSVTAVTP
ncbi:hypothetical protein [Streptomyces sp. S.PNR 29]|uniref:hypothetical protein n=1 Tax=Streptomyces sp. S.PNR 29 TaxID=2973805 RepID=UPI0025B03FA9|nr:hypothetical protein [Streptomyces sp. S.PNR 29]MDN0195896.1 hypothetical protein [Streptomyces sp. S.PNR 29]